MKNKSDCSLGEAEHREYGGGMGLSPLGPAIKSKLRKKLRKLDRDIHYTTSKIKIAEILRMYISQKNNVPKLKEKLKKLDSKRFWVRLQLKGYQ